MNKKKNIAKAKTGFKTPNNYFKNFQVNTPSYNEQEGFKNNTENKSIDSGFKIPQGYFENFEVSLPQAGKKGKVISLFNSKTIAKISAIAAIFLIGFFILKNQFSLNPVSNQQNIDSIALEEALEKDFFDLGFRDFEVSLSGKNSVDEDELKSIDEQAIVDYLSENAELITLMDE